MEKIAGQYPDLNAEELAEVAQDDFDGDVEKAADHLRRLREWYVVPASD